MSGFSTHAMNDFQNTATLNCVLPISVFSKKMFKMTTQEVTKGEGVNPIDAEVTKCHVKRSLEIITLNMFHLTLNLKKHDCGIIASHNPPLYPHPKLQVVAIPQSHPQEGSRFVLGSTKLCRSLYWSHCCRTAEADPRSKGILACPRCKIVNELVPCDVAPSCTVNLCKC